MNAPWPKSSRLKNRLLPSPASTSSRRCPTSDGRLLLLTTKHALCTQPATLAYNIAASEADIPTIHWLGKRDHDQLTRLCTGPLRSPYRQAILHFLHQSDTPQSIPTILEATSYDREAGRKMLLRMKMAGELVSPARGLYTTAQHPCLLHLTNETSPVPNVTKSPQLSHMSHMSQPLLIEKTG